MNELHLPEEQLREMHLFAGAGGGILGGMLCGHTTVCAVEIEEYPRKVLLQRQRDGILPSFPIWDDITTFDGTPWRGSVDVICGGWPCQDVSAAGGGKGLAGERSGLWREYKRVISEVRPQFVFAENSPLLRTRGLVTVLKDLTELGYDVRWGVLGAWHTGAPHKRDRMWILANSNSSRFKQGDETMAGRSAKQSDSTSIQPREMAYPHGEGLQGGACASIIDEEGRKNENGHHTECSRLRWTIDPATIATESVLLQAHSSAESGVDRMVDGLADRVGEREFYESGHIPRVATGVPNRVARLKAIGNGQVPLTARVAFKTLSNGWI